MFDFKYTALMSSFVVAYHYENYKCRIYSNKYSIDILNKDYNEIKRSLIINSNFFIGNNVYEDNLKEIVNNYLSSNVLVRNRYNEDSLINSLKMGAEEYIVYASGYDTSIIKLNKYLKNIKCFEIDRKEIIEDKIKRLDEINHENINYISCDLIKDDFINKLINKGYDKNSISFNSILGLSYYLTKYEFETLISKISDNISSKSTIIFDYYNNQDSSFNKTIELSNGMIKTSYSYKELVKILSRHGLLIYEHLESEEVEKRYYNTYNLFNKSEEMHANKSINYCLCVKE